MPKIAGLLLIFFSFYNDMFCQQNAADSKFYYTGIVQTIVKNNTREQNCESRDRATTSAKFCYITVLYIDDKGLNYLSDKNRIKILGADKRIITVAGSGEEGNKDGKGAQAVLDLPPKVGACL